jgi:hypothetical protein
MGWAVCYFITQESTLTQQMSIVTTHKYHSVQISLKRLDKIRVDLYFELLSLGIVVNSNQHKNKIEITFKTNVQLPSDRLILRRIFK